MAQPVFAVKKINGVTLVDCRIALTISKGTDLLASGDAASDQRTEGNAVAGWTGVNATLSSTILDGGVTPLVGTYFMKILGDGGAGVVGSARQSITTVVNTQYRVKGAVWVPAGVSTQVTILVGTAAGGSQIKSFDVLMYPGWNVIEFNFVPTGTTTHITVYGADNGTSVYVDDMSVTIKVRGKFSDPQKFLYPRRFLCVTAWTHGSEVLKITDRDGNETSLSNAASKGFAAGTMYGDPEIAQFRSDSTNETGFEIICYY